MTIQKTMIKSVEEFRELANSPDFVLKIRDCLNLCLNLCNADTTGDDATKAARKQVCDELSKSTDDYINNNRVNIALAMNDSLSISSTADDVFTYVSTFITEKINALII